ncbi:MAG: DNA translocase FtsK [Verrucomicrobia bacterium]|nr:DNA translocase FtsK [Verrucomicrobiota bacterium]MBU1909566.1 DNA translocase FtsK [Verrucomicrobiota bacterium]
MAVRKEIVRTGWRDAAGILLIAFGVLLVLSLGSYRPEDVPVIQEPPNSPTMNFVGPVGAWLAFLLFMGLGLGAWLAPLLLGTAGFFLIFQREGRFWPKAVWMLMGLLSAAALIELHGGTDGDWLRRVNASSPGGLLGYGVGEAFLARLLGRPGTTVIALAVLLASIILVSETHPLHVMQKLGSWFGALGRLVAARLAQRRQIRETEASEQKEIIRRRQRLEEAMREAALRRSETARPAAPAKPSAPESISAARKPEREAAVLPEPPRPRKPPKPTAPPAVSAPLAPLGAMPLPGLDLLDPIPPDSEREIKGDFRAGAEILKDTLSEFGVEVDITHVESGPVVTRYELLPAPGVRVEKIVALSNNIALAMKAESVRVQAPIPGKGVVGIEVPNSKTTLVCVREILESAAWKTSSAALPLALGKDVGGRDIVADLGDMPHLLIAGATGSGKTVCMNSILAGLLMSRTPDQMRLMLIDPKIVEFSVYNHLPHLVVPVITDPKKVSIGLRWAINEMEKRYKLFAKVGVRNIHAFNRRPLMKQTELFQDGEAERPPGEHIPDRLPYIVIVVDELADLMLVAQAEIELSITRLAQLSRAVGIHMILATQRPSVNVITGTIKANFPARISFQVAQKVDSRTILDANGADKLLGKGDMLFLPPGTSKLVRAQGTLTTDAEIRRLTEYWRGQGVPRYEATIKEKIEGKMADLPEMEEDDNLLDQAIEVIRQTRRASTSSLQRRLRIGYTRAARLIDLLEERGVVGPPSGSDPREILIDLDGEIPQNEPDDEG